MCHALLHHPKFLTLFVRIDHELAAQRRAQGRPWDGVLHRSDYPLKPRGCPRSMRDVYSSRLSFCCAARRKRATSLSVRFLGQPVYLALAVVLVSGSRSASTSTGARLGTELGVARQTLQRWQAWWNEQFPPTPFWRATCVRFMPPQPQAQLPSELIARFAGPAHEALMQLLIWLSPMTVGRGQRSQQPIATTLDEGR